MPNITTWSTTYGCPLVRSHCPWSVDVIDPWDEPHHDVQSKAHQSGAGLFAAHESTGLAVASGRIECRYRLKLAPCRSHDGLVILSSARSGPVWIDFPLVQFVVVDAMEMAN
jgi:hypothetical protein